MISLTLVDIKSVEYIIESDQRERILAILSECKTGRGGEGDSVDPRKLALAGENLSGADLSGLDLSGADLTGTDLSGARLFRATLKGATLLKANLKGAELTGADLTNANLTEAQASQAGLGMACLHGAILFSADLEGATLSKADISSADFRGACLRNARIREANLTKADFTGADLREADLALSNAEKATFNNADMRGARLRLVGNFAKASWIGVDLRDINFAGAYQLRRFVADQNYLKEFKESSRFASFLYNIWWLTSNCGRSLLRWFLLIGVQALFFAWLYTLVGVDYGDHPTWLSPLYYSVVTLTTLGYGDIVPASLAGQVIAMLEVLTGYVMLGGLLSILSNKIARRAD